MIKKAIVTTLAVMFAGTFLFGRDVRSYLHTTAHSVRDAVKREVPIEFEVQRARKMVEQLVPDIRQCMHVVAEQQVELEHLRGKIASTDTGLEEQRLAIFSLREELASGGERFVFAGRTYSADDVQRDLTRRFDRFQLAENSLKQDRQILAAREKALQANQDKLATMLTAKGELEVQLEQLTARMKAVQAAETVSELAIDESALTRAQTLIRELNKQLDVKEQLLDAEGQFANLIPLHEESANAKDIVQRVDSYFGMTPGDAKLADATPAN